MCVHTVAYKLLTNEFPFSLASHARACEPCRVSPASTEGLESSVLPLWLPVLPAALDENPFLGPPTLLCCAPAGKNIYFIW